MAAKTDGRVRALEEAQRSHEAFRADHADEYADLDLIGRATIIRRLRLTLSSALDHRFDPDTPQVVTPGDPEADLGAEW